MRIAVAMSGGVDSSVTAALLQAEGHDVVGLTMKLWVCAAEDPGLRPPPPAVPSRADLCCSPRDVLDARAVCEKLGVPHHLLDLSAEFSRRVIVPFIAEYARGRTPNPCVTCNEQIKFKALREHARALGCEALATGHYARIEPSAPPRRARLLCALDPDRDQSYFLFTLTQDELAYLRFPLGALRKTEVRRHAAALGLAVAEKPDSQEICFVRDNDHRRFLRERAAQAFTPGPILFEDGRQVGTHEGLAGYTIGQRRGLGVAWKEPLYVVALDLARNAVVLGPDSSLWADSLEARALHWIAGAPSASGPFAAQAKIRHRNAANPCTVEPGLEGCATVRFDQPVRAVTPGQAVVLYDGEEVLGGGWIER